ncbi:MAG: zinc metallopeptidase [Bacilli bacterium]|nr:zinc metallopeptidase [Bacilli bacterium]
MISFILLIISFILVASGYLIIIFTYLFNKNKELDITAADQVLKILDDDSAISLIEDKDAYFNHYNIKRHIVKLKAKTYNSKDIFSISVATLLSGYYKIKDKSLVYVSYVFKELKIFSFIPVITLIISYFVNSIGDSKISIVIFMFVLLYQYVLNNINTIAMDKINIAGNDINKIVKILTKTSTIFFVSTLVQVMRLVVIILKI